MSTDMDRVISVPWWRRRMTFVAAAAVVVVGLLLFGLSFANGAKRSVRVPRATVTIGVVERGDFHDFTLLSGKLMPKDTVIVGALEGGQVEKILARAGDQVTAGQGLMEFTNTQLELDVLDREGRLLESITQLQTFQKQLEDTRIANERAAAQIDFNIKRLSDLSQRRQALMDKGYVSGESYAQIREELDYNKRLDPLQAESNARQERLRQDQLPRIQAELDRLRKSLEITRNKLDNLVVKAPAPGLLIGFNPNLGQTFSRGERLGEIVLDTGFKVSANVDQYYLGRVHAGQAGAAQIDGKTWKLKVDRVFPQVKDGTFVVELIFDGPTPSGLLPGATVSGRLSLGGDQTALLLPTGAFLEGSGGDWVMVLTSENRADRRRIKIGRRNIEQVEVLSGLKPGDRVITSDYSTYDKIEQIHLTK